MVPIPPPPSFGANQPPPPPPPGPDHALTFPPPGALTLGWRWVLTLGWVGVVVGLIAVGNAADVINKPPFWLGEGVLVLIPFALPVAATIAAFMNHPAAIWIGLAAVVGLIGVAVVDIGATPGVAAAIGALALVGLLTTLAAFAGRMPPAG